MTFAAGVTVSVERPGGEDQYGIAKPPATHTVAGCGFAPAGSSEQIDDESTVEWDLDLINQDAGADFAAQDVVLRPGDQQRYQVHGEPKRFRSPFTGWDAGLVVRLKGVQG